MPLAMSLRKIAAGIAAARQSQPTLRREPGRRAPGSIDYAPIRQEAENICLLIAVVASALNFWSRQTGACRQIRLGTYLPPRPYIFPALVTRTLRFELSPTCIQSLQNLYDQMAIANRMVRTLLRQSEHGDVVAAEAIDHARDAWCALSASAVHCIVQLEDEALCRPAMVSPQSINLRRLLAQVRSGEHPCVVDGQIDIPFWAQRRRHNRYATSIPVELASAQAWARAVVQNISRSGCALYTIDSLKSGADVTIRFPDRSVVHGRVVWSSDKLTGVEFALPLPLDDLLSKIGRPPAWSDA